MTITFTIPIRTVSEANKTGEHWSHKSKRHRGQRTAVIYAIKPWVLSQTKEILPCIVTLTRIAPRRLDIGDNLPMSQKTIRDQLAELLTGQEGAGRGDGDDRLTFIYKQEKGKPKEYAVIVEIQSLS